MRQIYVQHKKSLLPNRPKVTSIECILTRLPNRHPSHDKPLELLRHIYKKTPTSLSLYFRLNIMIRIVSRYTVK